MNEEGTQPNAEIEAGAAGAPEGTPPREPSQDEIGAMYKELGIKAPKSASKSEKRPKATDLRDKDAPKKESKDSDNGKSKDADDKDKSKDAPNSDEDGSKGDDSDSKGKKVGKDSGKVSDKSEDADEGVHDPKSSDEKVSKSGSEKDSEQRDERTGEEEAAATKEQDPEGKRPGKSNPEVEQRFQKLTQEKREREEMIEKLQRQLTEKDAAQAQAKIAQDDPEYTIDDFRKVKDNEGNIVDLDAEQAELYWRRWEEGYRQRGAEREAANQKVVAETERQEAMSREIMAESVKAYDTLAGLMDEYPELVTTSGKFDSDFATEAMPIIQDSIQYAVGTEPGNTEDNLPVILGLKIDPRKILNALKKVGDQKRTLPLNGVNDNVESRSNVGVPHTRSSDPTVNAANDLYKELGISKRI